MTRYSISSQFYGAHLYNWHGNYLWFWSMQIGQFTNTNSVLLQHHQGAIIIFYVSVKSAFVTQNVSLICLTNHLHGICASAKLYTDI